MLNLFPHPYIRITMSSQHSGRGGGGEIFIGDCVCETGMYIFSELWLFYISCISTFLIEWPASSSDRSGAVILYSYRTKRINFIIYIQKAKRSIDLLKQQSCILDISYNFLRDYKLPEYQAEWLCMYAALYLSLIQSMKGNRLHDRFGCSFVDKAISKKLFGCSAVNGFKLHIYICLIICALITDFYDLYGIMNWCV